MGAGPALRPPPSSRLSEVPAVAPGFASTLGGQCQLFGHFRGERKSLRGCARPASAVSHRSAPRHAAPPGCAPGAEAGPSRPGSATASPSAPRAPAPAPALPSAAGGMRCRGGGRGGIHQPSEGGWQGTVRPSQGENTRLRVRHAAPTGRAGSRTVATPRHPWRRSRQARGGATRRPFSRRETEARRREGGSLPGVGTSTPAGLRGGGAPHGSTLSCPPPALPGGSPCRPPAQGAWPTWPEALAGSGASHCSWTWPGRRLHVGDAPHSPPPRCPGPPSLPLGLLPPTAQTGPLSNAEPLSRWFSSDGAHRPGPRFGGIRRSWCLPHARLASSRVLLPRPQGS